MKSNFNKDLADKRKALAQKYDKELYDELDNELRNAIKETIGREPFVPKDKSLAVVEALLVLKTYATKYGKPKEDGRPYGLSDAVQEVAALFDINESTVWSNLTRRLGCKDVDTASRDVHKIVMLDHNLIDTDLARSIIAESQLEGHVRDHLTATMLIGRYNNPLL